MRIPFVAGTLKGGRSRLVVAPGRDTRPFPGPWQLRAIIGTPEAEGTESARHDRSGDEEGKTRWVRRESVVGGP